MSKQTQDDIRRITKATGETVVTKNVDYPEQVALASKRLESAKKKAFTAQKELANAEAAFKSARLGYDVFVLNNLLKE
jgi:hypothetical protein